MPEWLVRVCWATLVAVHLGPAAVLLRPSLVQDLYGIAPDGDLGVLLTHRGALFLVLVIAGTWAAISPVVRPLVALCMAVSVISFLVLYAAAGLPAGPLRTIAAFDVAALLPLTVVVLALRRGFR
jgi:hypothetical protein